MGPVIAGAGIAARGFASYMAKKKAREAAARAAVRSTGSASIPNLVTSSRPSGLGPFASRLAGGGAAVLGGSEAINAMTQQPNGGDLHPRIEAMERLRNPKVGMAGLSGGYMANPRMGSPSQDPSYDASMTQEGQIQTMMEEMDGMDISEEAKYAIIRDKLDLRSEPIKEIPDKNLDLLKEYREGGKFSGAGVTSNEMKMFMGRPVQTSGYDRGPIRPRYDEFGNLIPQRPTMMV